MGNHLENMIYFGVGVFAICAAASDWQWYWNHPTSKFLIKLMTKKGARITYGCIGAFLLINRLTGYFS